MCVYLSNHGAREVSKYDPLTDYLGRQKKAEIPLRFSEIEAIVGALLPPSAHTHRAWWSNNASNNVMTKAWLAAGYRTANVDLQRRKVTFQRVSPTEAQPANATPAIDLKGGHHPILGRMKGTVRIEIDLDLTQPVDPNWGATS